jgi:hypothetical protein
MQVKQKERDAMREHHRQRQFPHVGGCPRCREIALCNVCGCDLEAIRGTPKRCTNGRCINCHNTVCTPGEIDAPGHGFGSRERAERAAQREGE